MQAPYLSITDFAYALSDHARSRFRLGKTALLIEHPKLANAMDQFNLELF